MEGTFVHIIRLLMSHGVVPNEIHDAEEEWNKYAWTDGCESFFRMSIGKCM